MNWTIIPIVITTIGYIDILFDPDILLLSLLVAYQLLTILLFSSILFNFIISNLINTLDWVGLLFVSNCLQTLFTRPLISIFTILTKHAWLVITNSCIYDLIAVLKICLSMEIRLLISMFGYSLGLVLLFVFDSVFYQPLLHYVVVFDILIPIHHLYIFLHHLINNNNEYILWIDIINIDLLIIDNQMISWNRPSIPTVTTWNQIS